VVTALIFDCDGVLADTERDGHRVAFNQMFQEFGVPFTWSEESYGQALAIAGGKERMRSLLTDEFVERAGLPQDIEGQKAVIADWHRRKTEIYYEMVTEGRLPARPGVARIAADAAEAGWSLAVASTSSEPSVRAVLAHVMDPGAASRFCVLAGDIVANKKPAPDIYELALERLPADPGDAIVIEDSRNGLLAAAGAGLACLVTVSSYTANEDFSEAALVVSSLGEPGGEETKVLATHGVRPSLPYVTLDDLTACLAQEHTGPRPDDGGSGG
jgi:HAD superfamily hydrolase (TIGR01509 family)